MIELPEVTLLIYNPDKDSNVSARVLNHCCKHIKFGAVKHLCSEPPTIPSVGEVIVLPKSSWEEGQRFQSYGINEFFDTRYVFHIETDGYPVNFDLWNNDFLSFDYIGAPWPVQYTQNNRVGNGGCSIRSKKFTQYCWDNQDKYIEGMSSDIWFCQYMYEDARKHVYFAPLNVAQRFSFELPVHEYPDWTWEQSFAFHGKFAHLYKPLSIIHYL